MKTNIFLLGLNRTLVQSVAHALSVRLDMFYADVDELLKFELTDIHRVTKACGADYVEKLEKKQVRKVSTFENTLYTMSYATFNANHNEVSIKKHALVIFLDLPKENCYTTISNEGKILDECVYKDRRNICEQYADITIKCKKIDEQSMIKDICEGLEKAFSEEGK